MFHSHLNSKAGDSDGVLVHESAFTKRDRLYLFVINLSAQEIDTTI